LSSPPPIHWPAPNVHQDNHSAPSFE
jgi:hypothetical protein